MNIKKILLIILFLAVAGGVGFLLYRVFLAPPPGVIPPGEEEPGGPVTGLPPSAPSAPGEPVVQPDTPIGLEPSAPSAVTEVAQGGPTVTTEVEPLPTLEPTMTASGSLNYYNESDGKFYRTLPDGSVVPLSEREFLGADEVTWSNQGDKAVIGFPDDAKVLYDFETQRQVTLPRHWEEFSFSGDDSKIAAKSMSADPENRWLVTFDPDGSNAQLVEHLGGNADKVQVRFSPDSSVVAFSDTGDPAGFDTKEILLIGQNSENFKALRIEGFGFEPIWAPSGKSIIYSSASQRDNYLPKLWFVNAKGDRIGSNRTSLELNTWADKCTFANESTVYCAVPDELPTGAGLQREVASGIPDSIYKVDLRSGGVNLVGRPENDTAISSLRVSPDGSSLFFQSESTGSLQSMRLR